MLDQISHIHKSNRVSFAYFHGVDRLEPEFVALRNVVLQNLERIFRVQVTNDRALQSCMALGLTRDQIRKIYIGVDTKQFRPALLPERIDFRVRNGIPADAFVIGSFQKDGIGWDEGLSPKVVKGPDILVRVLANLKSVVKTLFVVLTGPSRGFVKQKLTDSGVRFKHFHLTEKSGLSPIISACDTVLVTSREEGGPKSVLEGMASGVPVVSTQVGQAAEIIQHGVNGFLAAIEDTDALVNCCETIFRDKNLAARIIEAGISTAGKHDYSTQANQWREFFSHN